MRSRLFVVVFLVAAAAPARAETTYLATLDGLQNVPSLPEVTATGSAILVLNDAGTELSFTITFQGLTGTEIGAHIHNARPALNGPVVFALPSGSPKVGTWQIPPAMVAELQAGRLYINVHSSAYETGEIRGNIMEMELPVEPTTFGSLKYRYR